MKNKRIGVALCLVNFGLANLGLVNFASTFAHGQMLIDFEELPLAGAEFWNGSDGSGGFTAGGAEFNNEFTNFGSGCCWRGWAYSSATDTATPGAGNQYSAFAGGGAAGSAKYGVAFGGLDAGTAGVPEIQLPASWQPASVEVTNTTYAAVSMRDGDGFAKQFGGAGGDDPDWFLLEIEGRDTAGELLGSVPFYLADYRFADNSQDYVVDQWTTVNLTPLAGLGVEVLATRLSSSDVGPFGMNTPAYVAIDNLVLTGSTNIAGDFNGDRRVDADDLAVWQQQFGTDFDGRHFIDWQVNVGTGVASIHGVPESATLAAAFATFLISVACRSLRG